MFAGQQTSGLVSVCLGPPVWGDRALYGSKVDEFVPQTQHVNLRIVCQPSAVELEGLRTKALEPLDVQGSAREYPRERSFTPDRTSASQFQMETLTIYELGFY